MLQTGGGGVEAFITTWNRKDSVVLFGEQHVIRVKRFHKNRLKC